MPQHDFRLRGGWGAAPNNFYVAGHSNALARYDGNDWVEFPFDGAATKMSFSALWGYRPNRLFAVGDSVPLAHFDGTSLHMPTPSFASSDLTGVWAMTSDDVFVVGTGFIGHWVRRQNLA